MTTSPQTIRLFVEYGGKAAANEKRSPLDVAGLSSVVIHEGRLELVAGRKTGAIVLEPIDGEQQPLAAMLAREDENVRVNGLAAGPLHVLTIRDAVELAGGEYVLHLTLFQRPHSGQTLAEHVGRECPICLTPVTAEHWVLVCVHCQAVMHLGREEGTSDQLECARTTNICPCCSQRLAREEGYVYVPEI